MSQDATSDSDLQAYLQSEAGQPFWKQRKVLIGIAIAALALLAFLLWGRGDSGPQYITHEVEQGSLDITVTATGNLRPTNQVEVGSEVSGRIDDVLVDVNDVVTRGQVLARINTDTIEDQITQGQASLNAARAAVTQAEATLEVDEAQLARLREVHKLSGGKVPSKVEMEQAEGTVRRSAAALASARANVTSAQAALDSSVTNRERAVIRSPVSGVVLVRQVEPGQTVAASFTTPTLFVLAENLAVMQLRVDLDEADVGQVESGQEATFTVDAYPGERFPARVERVDLAASNIAETNEQAPANDVVSYEARLTVDNADGRLRPGMTGTATIATQSTGTALLVPNAALRFSPEQDEASGGIFGPGPDFGPEQAEATIGVGSRQSVYVLGDDDELRPVLVTTGRSNGLRTAVTSEKLAAGMIVVTGERAEAE